MKIIQKSLLLLLLTYATAVTSATSSSTLSHLENSALRSLWGYWKNFHKKAYNTIEEVTKFAVFAENYKKISHHNRENKDVKLALNKFSDLTPQEFKDLHIGGYVPSSNVVQKKLRGSASPKIDFDLLHFPESVDWREKGAVTEVKNQQQCGSCWAFSAAGALESLYFLTHGKLLSFSEQQIVDCDLQDGGCNGGLPEQAFQYTAQAGIETEQDYPYTGSDGQCKYDESKAIKVNTGSQAISPNNVGALKAALVSQPVAIAIQADQHVFQFYRSGVIKSGCGDDLNHAVLAVGYKKIDGEEAFIVKNSWGTKWGSEGYVYISTSGTENYGSGVCGILGDPVVPTV